MDNSLIEKIKYGDQEAFAELYNSYADYALRVATAVTKSRANGADAVQETFIRVYNNIGSFDLNRPFQPWFYRILINECNRIMRIKSKTIAISDYMENDEKLSGEDKRLFEEYEELYRAIEQLDDINRVPIILKYLKGFKEKEIADILGLNINTLKSRLFKGRQKLKNFLEKYERRRTSNG